MSDLVEGDRKPRKQEAALNRALHALETTLAAVKASMSATTIAMRALAKSPVTSPIVMRAMAAVKTTTPAMTVALVRQDKAMAVLEAAMDDDHGDACEDARQLKRRQDGGVWRRQLEMKKHRQR